MMPCGFGRPIAPAVGRLDGRPELLAGELRLLLALLLEVVEELEEHDPGEQRQPVEVAVQPLVLAHDVARGLEQAAEGLRRSGWRGRWPFFAVLRGIEQGLQFGYGRAAS